MKKIKIYGIGALALVAVVGSWTLYRAATVEYMHNVTFSRDGERVCSSGSADCRYLEYSEDETFENTDELAFLKYNSSDVHRQIRQGLTCETVKVYGWRIPFLSWYRNIIWVDGCK